MKRIIDSGIFLFLLLVSSVSHAATYWDTHVKNDCVRNGYRQWAAIIRGDPGNASWMQACQKTVGTKVGGSLTATPNRCVDHGLGGVWGEWDVADASCKPFFDTVQKNACSKFGFRQYAAIIRNVPPGMSDEQACRGTKVANLAGWEQPRVPDRCVGRINGMWGEWDSADGTCQSTFDAPKKEACTAFGKRLYTAHLSNAVGDWDYACRHTGANIAGQVFAKPDRCVKTVTGEWGEFHVNDSSCKPAWTNVTKDRCVDSGRRTFRATLTGLDQAAAYGLGFDAACKQTEATIDGPMGKVAFKRPTRCVAPDQGEFDVYDASCSPANDANTPSPLGAFLKNNTANLNLSCNDFCANSSGNFGQPGACVKATLTGGPNNGLVIPCSEKPAELYAGATGAACSCAPPATGFADTHAHQMAHLGFGGEAFVGKPFGPMNEALAWCTPIHGAGGSADGISLIIGGVGGYNFTGPGHHVGGFPDFDGWPRWNSLTHQSMYEDWLKRAVDGGLRLMVMHAVNNQDIFNFPINAHIAPGRSKEDMEAVDLQIAEAFKMQDHIDAKSGGAGKGWYRIVRSPLEARTVIGQGKLAVVLGIEVDHLFDCYADKDGHFGDGVKNCDAAFVETQLDRYFAKGVRHLHPIHFKENAFGGSANYLMTTWNSAMRDCASEGYEKECGAIGLKSAGRALIHGMMKRGMLIDVDHMSRLSFRDTMAMTEAQGYPVISGHVGLVDSSKGGRRHEGNLKDEEILRILNGGGMVSLITEQGHREETPTVHASGLPRVEHACGFTSQTFAQTWLHLLKVAGPNARIGFSTDFNGFAGEPGPRFGDGGCFFGKDMEAPQVARTPYPLSVAVTNSPTRLDRSHIGNKVFDINTDGLAHVGMLPDFVADLRTQGLRQQDLAPLMNSAESYIRMWEQAEQASRSVR